MSFKDLQRWRLPWNNPFGEIAFHNVQLEPPLAQLWAISSGPDACYLGEEANIQLTATSFKVVVKSNKVCP